MIYAKKMPALAARVCTGMGPTILMAHKSAQASPQRSVALGLHPSLLDDGCKLIIFLQ